MAEDRRISIKEDKEIREFFSDIRVYIVSSLNLNYYEVISDVICRQVDGKNSFTDEELESFKRLIDNPDYREYIKICSYKILETFPLGVLNSEQLSLFDSDKDIDDYRYYGIKILDDIIDLVSKDTKYYYDNSKKDNDLNYFDVLVEEAETPGTVRLSMALSIGIDDLKLWISKAIDMPNLGDAMLDTNKRSR